MSRKWLLFPLCLSVLFMLTPLSRAGLTLRVNESATRVLFEEQATRVLLSIENSLGRRVNAHIKLELIDTDGVVRATAETDQEIKPGGNAATVPIALWLSGKAATDTREVLWYRLRYRVAPAGSAQFDPTRRYLAVRDYSGHFRAPRSGASEGAGRCAVSLARRHHPANDVAGGRRGKHRRRNQIRRLRP